jgi:hypothetical protein
MLNEQQQMAQINNLSQQLAEARGVAKQHFLRAKSIKENLDAATAVLLAIEDYLASGPFDSGEDYDIGRKQLLERVRKFLGPIGQEFNR